MATEVVLCHSSPRLKVDGRSRLPLGPSASTGIVGQCGTRLGPANDIPTLQGHIWELLERDINFAKIIQVMLVRRILPCKRQPLRMWEFNLEGPRTIQHFFGMTPEGMYKLFFGPRIKCLDTTEDVGLSYRRLDTQVSNPVTEHFAYD